MLSKQLLLVYCFLLIAFSSVAQKSKVETKQTSAITTISSETLNQLPFSKNFNEFTVRQNFELSRIKPDEGDGHTTNVNLNIDYNRFVMDHLGVGVEIDLSSLKEDYNNVTSTSNSWMAYGNVLYGTALNSINLYGKLSVGLGKNKYKYGSTNTTEDVFGYKLEVGSPIHTFNGGGNYITPFIGYNVLQYKYQDTKTTDNQFELGFRFENYSPCSAYACDCHNGRNFSRNAYNQGRSFIGYSSMGDFGFGNSKFEVGNNETKTDFSNGALNFEYGYYFMPNLAIGAGINWNSQTDKISGNKYTSSAFTFMPMVTFNMPVDNCWNNFFLQGGYGFGTEKQSSGSTDQKQSLSNYCFYLGFNDYLGQHIAFTPKIGYDWETSKDKTTDLKTKWSGLEFSLGGSLHF